MIYIILFFFAIILARTQYMISKFNIGSRFNGFGVIENVLQKNIDAPMVYRVLVPWIVRSRTLWKYQAFQVISIYTTIISVFIVWGWNIMMISIVLLISTFWYDYWDWSMELLGMTLALTTLPLAITGVVLLGLSRETAPLIGLAYALHSGNYALGFLLSVIAVWILLLVRLNQGDHPLYCKRWMIKENWQLLKNYNRDAWLSVLLCSLGIVGALSTPEFIIVPIITVLGFTMAKANETRVFVIAVPYAALFINGFIK